MSRYPALTVALALAIFAITSWDAPLRAQEVPVPKLERSVCKNIQTQVDELVAVSTDTSLSDEQKVDRLSKSWVQSLSGMQERAKNDDEMSKMVAQLGQSVAKVLALAMTPGASGSKPVSGDAKMALKDLTDQVKPYFSFMKLLCPELVVPPVMTQPTGR